MRNDFIDGVTLDLLISSEYFLPVKYHKDNQRYENMT